MILPYQSDNVFLADVHRTRDGVRIWWLGQSGFLVRWQGRHLLFDPYLSDSLTRKYASTDKPHERMTARVIAPERLDFIDVVTSSHNHTDHLDAETLVPLMLVNPGITVVVPEANRTFASERLAVPPERLTGVDDGLTVEAVGFELTGIPAAHNELERDEAGRYRTLGYIARFGGWTLYHSGDTLHYEGMEDRLRPWKVDVAILPINGNRPERRVAGNLSGAEAARLARDIGARLVIPCHFDMFTFNTASPEEFEKEAGRLGQTYRVLRSGEGLSLPV